MKYLFNRLLEGSTHAGLAALMQALKMFSPQYSAIFDMLTMAFGSVAATLPDPKKAQ